MKDFQSLSKKIKNNLLQEIKRFPFLRFSPLIICFLLFLALLIGNSYMETDIILNKINSYSFSDYVFPYPQTKVLGASTELNSYSSYDPNNISALAFVVMDDGSKVLLFSKNESFRFSTASTAKIMTAFIALDYFKEKDILVIQKNEIEGSSLKLKPGDKFYFEDLLYAMLLPSANDAAMAIAQNYPGGEKEFVLKMNQKAKELNLTNTNFADPAGLLDDESFTTPIDLARLSSAAIKNPVIARIVSTKEKTIFNTSKTAVYELKNLNILLGFDGIKGIKTGYTEGAGGVLASLKDFRDGDRIKSFIIVVMKSQDRFADTERILQIIRENNIQYKDF